MRVGYTTKDDYKRVECEPKGERKPCAKVFTISAANKMETCYVDENGEQVEPCKERDYDYIGVVADSEGVKKTVKNHMIYPQYRGLEHNQINYQLMFKAKPPKIALTKMPFDDITRVIKSGAGIAFVNHDLERLVITSPVIDSVNIQ
jgi:hypothetical protein